MTRPDVVVRATTPVAPPHWALLERQLLDTQATACEEFFARYFDERGYLLCVPRWSGDDGPDDALENLLNWTMLHALGADDRILALYKKGLDGHFRQYTEAKTTDVELEVVAHQQSTVATTTRLGVTYSPGATSLAPQRLFLKTAHPTEAPGLMFHLGDREVRFYTRLAPAMASVAGFSHISCYSAVADPALGKWHVLIDDLTET